VFLYPQIKKQRAHQQVLEYVQQLFGPRNPDLLEPGPPSSPKSGLNELLSEIKGVQNDLNCIIKINTEQDRIFGQFTEHVKALANSSSMIAQHSATTTRAAIPIHGWWSGSYENLMWTSKANLLAFEQLKVSTKHAKRNVSIL
jgi:hypothetical protein